MASYIGREVEDFAVQAYHKGEFETVTKENILGHWSVFFFYPADFTFVCPTELGDLQDFYEDFKAARFILCLRTPTLYTRHGRTLPKQSGRSNMSCWQTRQVILPPFLTC